MTSSKLSTPRPRTGRRRIERGSPLLWPAGRAGAAWLAIDAEGTLVIVDPGLGYWFGLSDPDELLGQPLDTIFGLPAGLRVDDQWPRFRRVAPLLPRVGDLECIARMGSVGELTVFELIPRFLEAPHSPTWQVEEALDRLVATREMSEPGEAVTRDRLDEVLSAVSERALHGLLVPTPNGFACDSLSAPELCGGWTAPAELISILTSLGSVTLDARAVACRTASERQPRQLRAAFDPGRLWRALDLPLAMAAFEPVFVAGELSAVLLLGSPELAVLNAEQRQWLQRAAVIWGMVQRDSLASRTLPRAAPTRSGDELARERKGRIEAEAALRYRERLMEAIGRSAEQLLAEPGGGLGLDELVRRFGETLGAARACLYANDASSDQLMAVRQHRWLRPHADLPEAVRNEPPAFAYADAQLERWCERLAEGDLLYGTPSAFPEPERTMLRALGVESICVVPVFVDGQWWGFLCVEDFARPRTWAAIELDALRIAAQMVGSVVLHRRERERLETESATRHSLLREVNHRVKNNLATIIGMLYAARRHADEPERRESLFADLVARVEGLAVVHTLLSESSWRPLPVGKLCLAVCQTTIRGTTLASHAPEVSMTVDESAHSVTIDSARAHHLALIVNELTTNVAKHAALTSAKRTIELELEQQDDGIRLVFRDDGPGFPEAILSREDSGNVGFDLIRNVVRRNLRGSFRKWNDGGAVVELTFPLEDVARTGALPAE